MALVFNIFAGLTISVSNYSKSLNYEYESVKLESYGLESTLEFNSDYFIQLDVKRLSAGVQSGSGKLNIFGWDYTHDIGMLKFAKRYNENTSFYFNPTLYYLPILFPTQVGALSSTAAFEKTLTYGLGLGYISQYSFKKFDLKTDVNFSYLDFSSADYDLKYNYILDIDINPTFKLNEAMNIGLNYNVIMGQTSLTENKTGSEFPFKMSYFLHNLFLTFAYTLR